MALRHFGIYRDVGPEQAKLDKTAVKTLFRWGQMQESVLAARLHVQLSSQEWAGVLSRLTEYRLVEGFDRRQSKYLRLTPEGQGWGQDLCCEEQLELQEAAQAEFDSRKSSKGFDAK